MPVASRMLSEHCMEGRWLCHDRPSGGHQHVLVAGPFCGLLLYGCIMRPTFLEVAARLQHDLSWMELWSA